MSGWQLGLALFGCFLAGAVVGLTALGLWARKLWRDAQGKLAGQLLGLAANPTTTTGRPEE